MPPCTGTDCAPASQASLTTSTCTNTTGNKAPNSTNTRTKGRPTTSGQVSPWLLRKKAPTKSCRCANTKSQGSHHRSPSTTRRTRHHGPFYLSFLAFPPTAVTTAHLQHKQHIAWAPARGLRWGQAAVPKGAARQAPATTWCMLTLSTPGTKGAPAYLPTHVLCFRRFCRSRSPAARTAQVA